VVIGALGIGGKEELARREFTRSIKIQDTYPGSCSAGLGLLLYGSVGLLDKIIVSLLRILL